MTRAAVIGLHKWVYHAPLGLITAQQRVGNDDVEEALDWAVNEGLADKYYIYSGVHGLPSGQLQIDDAGFYKSDLELIQDSAKPTFNNPRITVVKKTFSDTPEPVLIQRVKDHNRLVIMAWCYSEFYYQMNLARF